jgi:hypothetical protein
MFAAVARFAASIDVLTDHLAGLSASRDLRRDRN